MQLSIEKHKLDAALYIVSTPIGNLKDITLRALEVLQSVDLIACEDTRVTAQLLSRYGIKASFLVYTDHAETEKHDKFFAEIKSGKSIALVSDAGTPLISDPGYKLVKEALSANIKVVTIPGACAAIAALSISGMATDNFYFAGFLPKKVGAAKDMLSALSKLPASLVFYERGSRIKESLKNFEEELGDREVVLARELTKRFEETVHGKISELKNIDFEERGEFVVIVEGYKDSGEKSYRLDDVEAFIEIEKNNYKPKILAEIIAEKFGLNKKDAYNLIINKKI